MYDIYVHAVETEGISKTNPQYRERRVAVAAVSSEEKSSWNAKSRISVGASMAKGLYAASKINNYVGELTENRVQQRRTSIGLTVAGFVGAGIVGNPLLAIAGAALYFGNKYIEYQIKQTVENRDADYVRQLTGGTAKTGR